MAFAMPSVMVDDGQVPPPRRGRRILVAVLVLLLVLLPLYLWPLRGSLGGWPGPSSLLGTIRDPRDPAAVARIPGEVWDVLMGGTDAATSSSPGAPPRNLTMISELEELTGSGFDIGAGGPPLGESPSALVHTLIGQVAAPWEASEGSTSGGEETRSMPASLLAGYPGGDSGDSGPTSGVAPGGYPSLGNLGPWVGGGPGGGSRLLSSELPFAPNDPAVPTPTPEPATLVLVGSNLALLGAAAWKRHRRRQETPTIG